MPPPQPFLLVASFEDEEHEEAWRTRRGAGRGLGCAATIKHAEPELAGALKGSLSVAATRQAVYSASSSVSTRESFSHRARPAHDSRLVAPVGRD
jgi:hypothetical protein